jgi:hypothetical protein
VGEIEAESRSFHFRRPMINPVVALNSAFRFKKPLANKG